MPDTDQPTTVREKHCRAHPQPHSAEGCLRGRLVNTLPPGNTMRMPGNCGAVLITGIEWFTRRKRWILLGKWKNVGPGWLHEAAPLMAAAVPARTASADATPAA